MSKPRKSDTAAAAMRHTWRVIVEDAQRPESWPADKPLPEQETMLSDASLIDVAAVERFVETRWPHWRFLRAERQNKFRVVVWQERTIPVDAPLLGHDEVKARAGEFMPSLGLELRRVVSCKDDVVTAGERQVKVHMLTLQLQRDETIGPGDFDATTAGNEAAKRNPGWVVGEVELIAQP